MTIAHFKDKAKTVSSRVQNDLTVLARWNNEHILFTIAQDNSPWKIRGVSFYPKVGCIIDHQGRIRASSNKYKFMGYQTNCLMLPFLFQKNERLLNGLLNLTFEALAANGVVVHIAVPRRIVRATQGKP